MYEVYGMPRTRTLRVTWALEELGVEYRYHLINLMEGEGQKTEFLQLNPMGKIPVLVDGDLVLSESAAICTYLGDQHPESELVPRPGTVERAKYDQWCFFTQTELEQPLWTIHKHRFVFPDEKKVPEILTVAPWEFERAAAAMAKGLGEREFLVGDSFTLADVQAAHTLLWARVLKLPYDFGRLESYEERICSRDAFARAKQRDKAIL